MSSEYEPLTCVRCEEPAKDRVPLCEAHDAEERTRRPITGGIVPGYEFGSTQLQPPNPVVVMSRVENGFKVSLSTDRACLGAPSPREFVYNDLERALEKVAEAMKR